MYCKSLTKKELIEAGIVSVEYVDNEWQVIRHWYKNNSKQKFDTKISITLACGKHKYRRIKALLDREAVVVKYTSVAIPIYEIITRRSFEGAFSTPLKEYQKIIVE